MEERPDYVPPAWTGGKLNNWAAARPQRVFGFFVLLGLLVAGLVVWAAANPHDFFAHPRNYVALLTVPLFLWQAAIYVPRTLRAMRGR
jgi:hypothetical protein